MKNKDEYMFKNKKQGSSQSHKRRTITIAGVVCFMCVLGMVGVYRLETENTAQEEPLVDWEDSVTSDLEDKVQIQIGADAQPDVSDEGVVTAEISNIEDELQSSDTTLLEADVQEAEQETLEEQTDIGSTEAETSVGQDAVEIEETQQTAGESAIALQFSETDSLSWPVGGSIILDYSMDATTYFPTLDQYKYNPAVLLQAEVGDSVCAAASGLVESIVESDETGLTVTMNIGNGYQLVYGQLKGINYSTGAYIEKGSLVGTVASPTKYYSVEGSNLYFKMLKDSIPVDPVGYMHDGQTVE